MAKAYDIAKAKRWISSWQKRQRAKRVAVGLCPQCGCRPPEEGRHRCDTCREAVIRSLHKLRKETLEAYGNVCACCGESRLEFLCIDHINGGGNKHRAQLRNKGGTNMYRWLRKSGWPEGYRVMCWNCNSAIANHGRCPHQEV